MLYRKKPVVVEAVQYDGTEAGIRRIKDFVDPKALVHDPNKGTLAIETLEGKMLISINDWVIKGTVGEFYPCKPQPFKDTFEAITEGK